MDELTALIREEILDLGPIRFDRFMELALYHPTLGYYRRVREGPRTGRGGDFYTSVSVGPLFGRLLARQFMEMWEKLEKPKRFWILEQGCEDAQLACDILGWCAAEIPQFYEVIRYALIEGSDASCRAQEKKLGEANVLEKVAWFREPAQLSGEEATGVFFSNELVDAFPVRVIIRKAGAWQERHVAMDRDARFVWAERSIKDQELMDAIAALRLPHADGYATEISLRARTWMEAVARIMRRGYVLTIDYGFPAAVYYSDFRTNGTLSAYRSHRRVGHLFEEPGTCDLTAHVDFTALEQAGSRSGLVTLGFVDQQHFLTGIAERELAGAASHVVGIADHLRAWNTLTHPEYLGAKFQILLQCRDAPGGLAGLRYAPGVGLSSDHGE